MWHWTTPNVKSIFTKFDYYGSTIKLNKYRHFWTKGKGKYFQELEWVRRLKEDKSVKIKGDSINNFTFWYFLLCTQNKSQTEYVHAPNRNIIFCFIVLDLSIPLPEPMLGYFHCYNMMSYHLHFFFLFQSSIPTPTSPSDKNYKRRTQ